MSLNKEFLNSMKAKVDLMVEKGSYDQATHHVHFGEDAVVLPEGVTPESIGTHIDFFNSTAAAAEVATAQIARTQYETNDKLTTIDSTFSIGGFNVNSQHHLSQQVGEDHIYGQGVTAVDYRYGDDLSAWVSEQRDTSVAQATKLFG